MRTLALALLLALGAALPAVGCGPVPAWKRSTLMRRAMQPDPDPLATGFETHVHRTREAMAGAAGSGGPSCGCN